jgi:ubiquinone/menaquinone biosynthesis C-methylase UbiE
MTQEQPKWDKEGGAELYAQIRSPKFSLVYPDLVTRIQKQGAQSLLDFGCGSGAFLQEFTAPLPIRQVGYDIDPKMCEMARKNCEPASNIAIVDDLDSLSDKSFDAIPQTAVWMVLQKFDACVSTLKTIHRLLSPGGLFYAAITHPCFRDRNFRAYSSHLDMNHYLDHGFPYKVEIGDKNKSMTLTDCQWSLTAISNQLKESNFAIDEIHEYPDVVQPAQGTPWMLIVASKRP